MTTKSAEWHAARVGKITGSRLPKILGLSTFGTAKSVMREMVREHFGDEPEFVDSPPTMWGTEHEDDAIAQYMIDTGELVHTRHGFFVHPQYEWLQIEPDGLVGEDGVVEAKCPWRAHYVHVSQRPDYEVQIRAAMDCTGRKWGDLAVWYPDPPLWRSRVEHDPDWLTQPLVLAGGAILPPIMPVLDKFRADLERVIESERLAEPFRRPLKDIRTDEDFAAAEVEYAEALAVKSAAEAQVAAAKARLEKLSAGRSCQGRYFHVIHTNPKGKVNYSKVLEKYAPDVDLESFRGEGSHTVTIRAVGSAK